MTTTVPENVQTPMLLAVNNFDEAFAVNPDGTPRTYTKDTERFFKTLATWAPVALVGDFSMTTDTATGEIVIKFTPKS